MFIENWSFHPVEAAEIVGVSEGQIGNWYDRYGLFPEMERGKGVPVRYGFRHLLQFAAVKALVDAGISPAKAAEALRPYSVYGTFLHESASHTRYPGTMIFTRNQEGRWVGADTPTSEICIEIRMWPIFDRILPRAKARVMTDPARYGMDASEMEYRIADTEAKIEELRKIRGA